MPRIRRRNLPRPLFAHLLERIEQREITTDQLAELAGWLDTGPEVPVGSWYKRLSGMIVCGEGELVKTFLLPHQTPVGENLDS